MDGRVLAASTIPFGFLLAQELGKSKPGQNVFVSPLSVAMALGMTASGAKKKTLEGMLKALQVPEGTTIEALNAAALEVLSKIQGSGDGVHLALANSLWANDKVEFESAFMGTCEKSYQAVVSCLNFKDPSSVAKVNDWVSEKTGGKITKVLDSFSPMDALVLVNAIFFKGTWASKFPAEDTTEAPFTLSTGKQRPHPLMRLKGKKFYYYKSPEGYEVVRLPYLGQKVSMYVFLPGPGSNPTVVLSKVSAQGLAKVLFVLREHEGSIALPRFKIEYGADLNSVLEAMGMPEAFDATGADFSGMSPHGSGLFLSQVKHKTFLEVNEEGTTAAGVTTATMALKSIPMAPFEMTVDRPFVCAITDDAAGALLFLGSIFDPGSA